MSFCWTVYRPVSGDEQEGGGERAGPSGRTFRLFRQSSIAAVSKASG